MKKIAEYIDHTLLKPEATEQDIRALCAEARQYSFASVCVNPLWVASAREELRGSGVKVCTVVGFPLGASSPAVKAAETHQAVCDGADEIDMVLSIGQLKSGDFEAVRQDIRGVVSAANEHLVKVIIEACLLTDEEKICACRLAAEAGAQFVKTSTGFSKGGATEHDVALMRQAVGAHLGVKAAGGIRTPADAKKMIAASADRIGTSAGVRLCAEEAK